MFMAYLYLNITKFYNVCQATHCHTIGENYKGYAAKGTSSQDCAVVGKDIGKTLHSMSCSCIGLCRAVIETQHFISSIPNGGGLVVQR